MLVDWDLARGTATRLIKPGPTVTAAVARRSVTELREVALVAEKHVVRYTGLIPLEPIPEVIVVDRPTWALSLLGSMEHTMEPLLSKLVDGKGPSGVTGAAGRKVTGLQIGTAVSWMASRVLGQYDPLRPDGTERLLLVAPNVVSVEQQLGVDPTDFRMWVALHEQTHRLQFCAVPWMRGYFTGLIDELGTTAKLDPSEVSSRLSAGASALISSIRGDASAPPLIEVMQGPEARVTLDKLVAFMSLLEGHADHVMDAIGPEVVPSVAEIRTKFEKRRGHAGLVDRVIKSLMGMDAKLAQYRDGGRFCSEVVAAVGVEGFSLVWESPANICRLARRSRTRLRGSRESADGSAALVNLWEVRKALRSSLASMATPGPVLVACSGGPDSLALAHALALEAPALGRSCGAVIVDHGWSSSSASRSESLAAALTSLGLSPVLVVAAHDAAQTETSARELRYAALDKVVADTGAAAVLLGHTANDQAEQVLLGLARGSGTRSLAGMPPVRGHYLRPLLGLSRSVTVGACAELGLDPYLDPTNADPRHLRARVRHEVLPLLTAVLGPGVDAALVRTAALARDDADALDDLARSYTGGLSVATLASLHVAVRRRVLKSALADLGCEPTASHLLLVDLLITDWHGQGPLNLPGGVRASREGGRIVLSPRTSEGATPGE